MSTTPVSITLRANEWGILADLLEDASVGASEEGRLVTAATARRFALYLNEKIKDR